MEELSEKDIIKFLVILSTTFKINDNDMIRYAFYISSLIIKIKDCS